MRRLPLLPPASGDAGDEPPVRTLLDLAPQARASLRAGSVRLAPGQRVPAEGDGAHAVDELSYIVAGSLTGVSGDVPFEVAAGDVTLIPRGERHWAEAGPDGAEIFWVFFGEGATED